MFSLTKKQKKYRREIIDLGIKIKSFHIAPAFSIVEILTVLYENILLEKDKFILSKGHGCLAFYNALMHKGLNPNLLGHPEIQIGEGIECTTGSLGHGLPMAVGMALAKKTKHEKGRIFVLMGDGECQEGTTWESTLIAAHHELSNLVVVIDRNKLQALEETETILALENLKKKFESFNFIVKEIDGHDIFEIYDSLSKNYSFPLILIANTVKGMGLSFMQNKSEWHSRLPEGKLLDQAYEELK